MTRQRWSPHSFAPTEPIFDPKKKKGEIVIGTTPSFIPDTLEVVGSVSVGQPARWATIIPGTDYCMVLTLNGYLITVDVSDPTAPAVVNTLNGVGDPLGTYYMELVGTLLYIGTGGSNPALSGLRIMNVSNPVSPTSVGFINLTSAHSVRVAGSTAFVTQHGGNGMTAVNVSNPASPSSISNVSGLGTILAGVIKNGNYCYVMDNTGNTIKVVNVTNTSSMSIVTSLGGVNDPAHPAVQGDYMYVPELGDDVLSVFDISSPAAPVAHSSFTDAALSGAFMALISGTYCYVSAFNADAMCLIDISNPASLSLIDSTTDALLNGPVGFDKANRYLYVACQDGKRLTILRINSA